MLLQNRQRKGNVVYNLQKGSILYMYIMHIRSKGNYSLKDYTYIRVYMYNSWNPLPIQLGGHAPSPPFLEKINEFLKFAIDS